MEKFDFVYTLITADKVSEIGEQTYSWWHVTMAVVPCFVGQTSSLYHSNTFTRRLLVIVVGVTIMLSNNYYQAFIINGMIVQNLPVPYTVEQLANKLYANEIRAVFPTSTYLNNM